jgi:transposase
VKLPPYSPDINIIELVWAELKRFLRKKFLKTKQEIADRVQKFFNEVLTIEKCQSYITRVKEVCSYLFSLKFSENNFYL